MAVHFFHCTDGIDLVLDRVGADTGSKQDLHGRAAAVAAELIASLAPDMDWSNWIVSVQDERGAMADVISFPSVAKRQAA